MICKRKICKNKVPTNSYRGISRVFCSKRCKNIEGVDVLRTKRKQLAIDYLGGKCKKCGYKKCPAAMHFHHIRGKDFTINRGITMAWEKIIDELNKCVLLCANCHAETHWEENHGR